MKGEARLELGKQRGAAGRCLELPVVPLWWWLATNLMVVVMNHERE